MKIKLVFQDWQELGQPVNPERAHELSKGDFHSGATFTARIDLDAWQEQDLREAVKKGYQPVFWVF